MPGCERRFTTYERIDEVPYMVVKKDGRREKFDRQKVLNGLLKACEKRPVSMAKLADLVNLVESKVSDSPDREISTIDIGEFLMENLRELDKIAYVRFASVYRDFQDEEAFFNELKNLMKTSRVQKAGVGSTGVRASALCRRRSPASIESEPRPLAPDPRPLPPVFHVTF